MLAALFNLLINYVVVLVFLIIQGGGPMWTWLYEFPILLLLLVVLATAISTLLSALFVRYRDIRPIWEVLLQTIYFVSLVLIPVEAVTNTTLRKLLLINPFACLIEQLRHAVISASAPTVRPAVRCSVWAASWPSVGSTCASITPPMWSAESPSDSCSARSPAGSGRSTATADPEQASPLTGCKPP